MKQWVYYVLVRPEPIRPPSWLQKDDAKTLSYWMVYKTLKELERKHPNDFGRIIGRLSGTADEKHGYVVCSKSISKMAEAKIRNIVLDDLSCFTLEEVQLDSLEVWDKLDDKRKELEVGVRTWISAR